MWFARDFIDLTVTFPGPNASTWVIREQIFENPDQRPQDECEEFDMISEARGVFICSKIEGYGPTEAVIKVVMQFVPSLSSKTIPSNHTSCGRIPWKGTEMQSAQERKLQRGFSESIEIEAMGLEKLTRANCSSTPKLLASKVVKQTETMWIPDGYLGFVVMTRLPGVNVRWIDDLGRQERQEMRQSFKEAWK
jgi:hypothetical protein